MKQHMLPNGLNVNTRRGRNRKNTEDIISQYKTLKGRKKQILQSVFITRG